MDDCRTQLFAVAVMLQCRASVKCGMLILAKTVSLLFPGNCGVDP